MTFEFDFGIMLDRVPDRVQFHPSKQPKLLIAFHALLVVILVSLLQKVSFYSRKPGGSARQHAFELDFDIMLDRMELR